MAGKARLEGRMSRRAMAALHRVADILDHQGITWCLESGTLLGIVREGRLLPWDNDLDLFVPASDLEQLLRARWRFWLLGFKVIVSRVSEDYGALRQGDVRIVKVRSRSWGFRRSQDKLLIDFFIKYPDEQYYYWSVGERDVVNKKIDRRFYDQMDKVEFAGRHYPIPCDVEEYLTRRYGDWRTPVKEWDFKRDDRAAQL